MLTRESFIIIIIFFLIRENELIRNLNNNLKLKG